MRTLNINIADVGGVAEPGDEVVVWAPRVRGSAENTQAVVSTAPRYVALVAGKATIEVEPGPLMLQLRCRGFMDTAPRELTVPTGSGALTLRSLIDSTEVYTPPVMSSLQQLLLRAAGCVEDHECGFSGSGCRFVCEEG